VTGSGEGYALIYIYFDPNKIISDNAWTVDKPEQFDTLLKAINAGYCQNYTVTCRETVIPDANGCATINGARICENQLAKPPIGGLSPFCKSATVVSNCGTDGGVNNTCKQYDANTACKFIKSTCITGAEGDKWVLAGNRGMGLRNGCRCTQYLLHRYLLVLALCNALMGLAYSLLLNQAAISTKQLQLFRPQLTH
jgi:hypothetical protein